ncbi:hypothetical protein EDB83DRAFT_2399738 [Lactarius deliciosus]|nr:hypothetical protein EDB83DRAFT_2399738 [Lactarius deliciosus]
MDTFSTQSFKFDCNALYIETHSLHQEGKYQWALIYIDPAGTITRLPTPTPKAPSRPASRHGTAPPHRESHTPTVPSQPPGSRGKSSQLLGYCKVGAYVGGLDRNEFEEVGNAALSGRKDGVRPSWLLQVLATLQERGYISWNEPIANVEGHVLEINREADIRWLQAFLRSTPYRIYATVIL